MTGEDGSRSRTHGLAQQVLSLQAKAIGIPLIQRKTSWKNYEDNFKKTVLELKEGGIEGGVFGDIDLEEHRAWVQRVCQETGIRAHMPLWGREQKKILEDFINLGFQATVVAINSEILDERWLGRKIDHNFLKDITHIKSITPCGEAGEYHTLVIDGPIFKKRITIVETRIIQRGKQQFLDISRCILEDKEYVGQP